MPDITDTIERLRDLAAEAADTLRALGTRARDTGEHLLHLALAYLAPPTLPTGPLQPTPEQRIPDPLDTGMIRIIHNLTREPR